MLALSVIFQFLNLLILFILLISIWVYMFIPFSLILYKPHNCIMTLNHFSCSVLYTEKLPLRVLVYTTTSTDSMHFSEQDLQKKFCQNAKIYSWLFRVPCPFKIPPLVPSLNAPFDHPKIKCGMRHARPLPRVLKDTCPFKIPPSCLT